MATPASDEYVEVAGDVPADGEYVEVAAEPDSPTVDGGYVNVDASMAAEAEEATHAASTEEQTATDVDTEADAEGRTLPQPPASLPKVRGRRQGVQVQKFTRRPNKAVTTERVQRTTTKKETAAESFKAAKEARANALARLDNRHKFVLGRVADLVGLSAQEAEEHLLEGGVSALNSFDAFFEADGSKQLVFYYQDIESRSKGESSKRLALVDPHTTKLTNMCVYAVRTTPRAITTSNMANEINFGSFSAAANDGSLLSGLRAVVADVLEPYIHHNENWGKLHEDDSQRDEFFDALQRFTASLSEADTAVRHQVHLAPYQAPEGATPLHLESVKTPAQMTALSEDQKAVEQLEDLLQKWCTQLAHAIAESEQMRREADDVGPRAELEHWKSQMAKFNGILDQIKAPSCQKVIAILVQAKSRVIPEWRRLDARITESANEAKDNVKYLYALDRTCGALYKSNPVTMLESVPNLMGVIGMIQSVSTYYNTSERVTALCVKITNQMITACKEYVYEHESRLWKQDPKALCARLADCRALNAHYQTCFAKEKQKLAANPDRRQFEFSEMSVFGKFDTFSKRTEKIEEVLRLKQTWSVLDASRIDGIDTLAVSARALFKNFESKPYDPLNTRKRDFDTDHEQLKNDLADLLARLQDFLDDKFLTIPSVMRALDLLAQFDLIKGVGLVLTDKYEVVLRQFGRELEEVRKIYQAEKEEPAIGRNLPPLGGRIVWARQLFGRIEGPMTAFQEACPDVLKSAEAKKIIKTYNKLGHVLMEFEMLYHRGWWRAVDACQSGLNASLLVRRPLSNQDEVAFSLRETGDLVVNIDPQIMQLIRETKIMQKLKLEIPESAKLLCLQEDRLRKHEVELQQLVREYTDVMAQIPDKLVVIIQPIRALVDAVIEPGLTKLSWMSPNLETYLQACYTAMGEFEKTLKAIQDLVQVRINAVLKDMRNTSLAALPSDEPWLPEELVHKTHRLCQAGAEHLELQSSLVELAVRELLDLLNKHIPAAIRDGDHMKIALQELYEGFMQSCVDSVVRCVRYNLDQLRRKLSNRSADRDKPACFYVHIELDIPKIVIRPELPAVQEAVKEAADLMVNVGKKVAAWGQERDQEGLESIYAQVAEHKEVIKHVQSLSTIVSSTKSEVDGCLEPLHRFSALWTEDKAEKTAAFLETKPDLYAFEQEVRRYEDIERDVLGLPGVFAAGALQLRSDSFQHSLVAETKAWKQAFGKGLNSKALDDMNEVFAFCDELQKQLSRPIKDLEDVRVAMNGLKDLREHQIRIDNMLAPIEQSYGILNKYEVVVPRAETERLDTLNFEWQKVLGLSKQIQDHLITIQPQFKDDLIGAVQKFQVDQSTFVEEYNVAGPGVEGITPEEASDRLAIFQMRFDELWRRFVTYSGGEELFGLQQTDYPELQRIKKELGLLSKLYSLYNDVIKTVNGYYDILWRDVDVDKINAELLDFGNRCRKLPKALKEWQAFEDLRKTIDDFAESCPLLESMSNPAMLPRHWARITDLTGVEFDVDNENFLLRNIMEADLLKTKEDIEDICIAAIKEQDIEAKLKQVINEWSSREVTFNTFKARGELLINAADISELNTLMEDSLMILTSLNSNRYNAPFKTDIQKWVSNLSETTDIVEKWLIVQNLWVYLEAVFVGGDIAKQLPKEAKRFSNIDKSWQKIMQRAHENPNLVQCCTSDETMSTMLQHMLEQLELCQKSLVGYLEKKRLLFPRFFFVSDTVLLEILGQASDSHTIQAHLLNVFDNIKTVTFNEKSYDQILAYSSREGESVVMQNPVMASGPVELWLGSLLAEQRNSLNAVIADASVQALDPNFKLIEFENSYPAQVGILGLQLLWTRDAEVALANARTDKKIMSQMDDKFADLLSQLIDATLQELTKVDRTKFETLVTLHVHQRDIFHDLVQMHIKSPQDFEWTKQARFYFLEEEKHLVVHITDVIFKYCLEFIGCVDRLCVTPLTDRCYITLAQALNLSMGGAPAGPAGTGKTETVKDMGRCLGKFVVVFNCSDQMDFRGLGRIYKGLAQSGAWGCFDEFNRIELPVLSVAAQQIAIVLGAKKERRPNFIFMDGDDVTLDPEFGLFLTMNPGYAGRQELPENLKIQFRSVAMMKPDRQIIIRVKLASCGFQNNVVLARKFYTLYYLCEQQLSQQ
ncbi:uncharacterized protein MONBRDRAFT_29039, partial [Monosiga brevicollis MX1]